MDKKTILQISAVILASALIFAGFAFALTRVKPLVGVAVPKEDVPYEPQTDYPQDTTLFFELEDGSSFCLRLRFKDSVIDAIVLQEGQKEAFERYGFYADETFFCSYSFIMDFVDTIDGITLDIFGNEMRYTGVQVCNILAVNKNDTATKVKVLKAIFNKIHKIGFSSEILYSIMNNTENTLSVPDCYGWTDFLGEMCNCYNFVNEE